MEAAVICVCYQVIQIIIHVSVLTIYILVLMDEHVPVEVSGCKIERCNSRFLPYKGRSRSENRVSRGSQRCPDILEKLFCGNNLRTKICQPVTFRFNFKQLLRPVQPNSSVAMATYALTHPRGVMKKWTAKMALTNNTAVSTVQIL
jgi:hypothetical protein